ncbi:hypothetical protein JCGZ_13494 [Jatropha curcas]|uniref:Uncharacterized protein n=1 Tax=Jatropha curcas TaxID=180498 RepID=A0A067LFL3_JATCU|nr:hypothetical protein JCGZ_13494 [Jatropha curcas]
MAFIGCTASSTFMPNFTMLHMPSSKLYQRKPLVIKSASKKRKISGKTPPQINSLTGALRSVESIEEYGKKVIEDEKKVEVDGDTTALNAKVEVEVDDMILLPRTPKLWTSSLVGRVSSWLYHLLL